MSVQLSIKQLLCGAMLAFAIFFVGLSLPLETYAADPLQSQSKIPDFKLQVPFGKYDNVPRIQVEGNNVIASEGLADYISQLYAWLILAISIVAVVVIMGGGFLYMTSRGNSGQVDRAKKIITNAVLGLALTLGSYTVLYTINPKLVRLPALRLGGIPKQDLPLSEIQKNQTSGGGLLGTSNITKNITQYDAALQVASQRFGVQCTLLKAFMYAESSGNSQAISPVGAQGLIQLMPATAASVQAQHGLTGSMLDPGANALAAAAYLSDLKKGGCNGKSADSATGCDMSNIQYLAAAYNGGSGANTLSKTCPGTTWWQCQQNEGYAETRTYAPRVEANASTLMSKGWGCDGPTSNCNGQGVCYTQ